MRFIKKIGRYLYWWWPFGIVYQTTNGRGETYTVDKRLWVIITNKAGRGADSLPLTFCSPEFLEGFISHIETKWWSIKETK
jgi:hypothetical protein